MKFSFLFIAFFLIAFNTFAGDATGATGFYISNDMTTYQASDVSKLLNQLTVESPDKNILFYVHGRSHTLEKEWNNINKVEQIYNVRVLMLHWDSWNNALGRPVDNTYEGSRQLDLGLHEVYRFKKNDAEFFKDHKMFLMFHSMGNIVLKNYLEKSKNDIQDPSFFDSIILTGADTPFTGHKKWLSTLNMSHDVYVVTNNKDAVLLASVGHDYTEIDLASKNDDRLGLGRGFDNLLFLNTRIAANALYFDVSGLAGSEHRHYLSSNQDIEDLFHFMFKEKFDQIPIKYKEKKNYYRF
nr:alpha/beta hydrolase [Bacteriovorax sp. HI3]